MISDDYDLLSAFLSAFRNEGGENPSVNFKLSVTGHYTDRAVPETMSTFRPTTTGEIAALLKKVPSKQCRLDPVPTWLVKQVSSVIAPVITNMCNASFDQRVLPASQKKAITVPLLKKPTLDSSDLNSFRPISNLSFVSKIVERVADSRFVEHVEKTLFFQCSSPHTESIIQQKQHLCEYITIWSASLITVKSADLFFSTCLQRLRMTFVTYGV